ncbi:FmdB family zinc ribbon protein [Thermodesulfovibrio hydrogeniphilus]
MPIYEYKCKKCGKTFEVFVPMISREIRNQACPNCGSEETEKLISQVSSVSNQGSSCFTWSGG